MEKTALAIEMLLMLKSRGVLKKQEIASELEISEKMVQRLRNELEVAGYTIDTITGKYGGYQLENGTLFPVSDLDALELQALFKASGYLMSLKHPLINADFKRAYSKIVANSSDEPLAIDSIQDVTLNFDPKLLDKYLNQINEAIQRKHRIEFEYQRKNQSKHYIFEPYSVFMVNQAWYVSGYIKHSHLASFKLNRILSLSILHETYLEDKSFNKNQYLSDFGFKVSNAIDIECIITNHNYLTEYIFGDKQEIEVISNNQLKVMVTFYSQKKTEEFVLKYGSDIKILKPKSLIEFQKNHAKKVLNL